MTKIMPIAMKDKEQWAQGERKYVRGMIFSRRCLIKDAKSGVIPERSEERSDNEANCYFLIRGWGDHGPSQFG